MVMSAEHQVNTSFVQNGDKFLQNFLWTMPDDTFPRFWRHVSYNHFVGGLFEFVGIDNFFQPDGLFGTIAVVVGNAAISNV